MKKQNAGFTLLEILVVVMIIAILATIVGVKVIPSLGKAKRAAAFAQIVNMKSALKQYRLDTGVYPTQEQGLFALCEIPTRPPVPAKYQDGGYLDSRKVPVDPWNRDYIYLVPGPTGEPFLIISYGSDGEPGGEGEDADISSADQ